MARLHPKPYPGDWEHHPDPNEPFSRDRIAEYVEREKRQLGPIQEKSNLATPEDPVGFLLKFLVADGFALYVVTQTKPLVIQHIPARDAWKIPDAHLRGLAMSDVLKQMAWDRAMKSHTHNDPENKKAE